MICFVLTQGSKNTILKTFSNNNDVVLGVTVNVFLFTYILEFENTTTTQEMKFFSQLLFSINIEKMSLI